MPYADPEKRREVKRKYEQEKRKQRRTNWMLVFYEDQCPEWREELDELGMPTLVSPSHDADEWTERDEKKNPKHKAGTLKEPHRHLLAMYDNPVSYDQVVKDFAFLKSKNVKYVKSLPAMARYLTHMDSPDKAQYDPEGVCEFGGAAFLKGSVSMTLIVASSELARSVRAYSETVMPFLAAFRLRASFSCSVIRTSTRASFLRMSLSAPLVFPESSVCK